MFPIDIECNMNSNSAPFLVVWEEHVSVLSHNFKVTELLISSC